MWFRGNRSPNYNLSPDRRRWLPILATTLFALVIIFLIVNVVAELNAPEPLLADLLFVVLLSLFPMVGWLIATKRAHNPLGWVYLIFPILLGIGSAIDELALHRAQTGFEHDGALLLIAGSWLSFSGYWLILGPGIMLFPDGLIFSEPFRWALRGLVALFLVWGTLLAFGTDRLCLASFGEAPDPCLQTVQNPLSLSSAAGLATVTERLVEGLFILTLGTSLSAVYIRYRRSTGDIRQQLRWVAWMAVVSLLTVSVVYPLSEMQGLIPKEWGDLAMIVPIYVGLPVTIGLAIFKYRLYDIDRLISRTLSYSLLTGVLLAIYLGSVALIQTFLPTESQIAIAGSTLVIASLFNPLRLRIQDAIDRRFYRRKYDAEKILAAFAASVRDEVNLGALSDEILQTVLETMQPEYASLWLLEDQAV